MIYTVTFNPSLDYIVSVDDFTVGKVNRTKNEIIFPGGKGINVSIVLKNLGLENTALGFIAGFTGEEIRKRVLGWGIRGNFITIDNGWSRINIKLRSQNESEINGQGPRIGADAIEKLYSQLDMLVEGDILILAGSIPSSMPDSMYSDIMKRMQEKGIRIVVDATKDLLVNTLQYKPFLIKPNSSELGEIFHVLIKDQDEVAIYARKLQEKGARNVLVSMAGEGAVFIGEDGQVFKSPAPQGKVVNSVGAGDSMVAGFLTGYLKESNYRYAFYMGVSAGSASAFSENLATEPEITAIFNAIYKENRENEDS